MYVTAYSVCRSTGHTSHPRDASPVACQVCDRRRRWGARQRLHAVAVPLSGLQFPRCRPFRSYRHVLVVRCAGDRVAAGAVVEQISPRSMGDTPAAIVGDRHAEAAGQGHLAGPQRLVGLGPRDQAAGPRHHGHPVVRGDTGGGEALGTGGQPAVRVASAPRGRAQDLVGIVAAALNVDQGQREGGVTAAGGRVQVSSSGTASATRSLCTRLHTSS